MPAGLPSKLIVHRSQDIVRGYGSLYFYQIILHGCGRCCTGYRISLRTIVCNQISYAVTSTIILLDIWCYGILLVMFEYCRYSCDCSVIHRKVLDHVTIAVPVGDIHGMCRTIIVAIPEFLQMIVCSIGGRYLHAILILYNGISSRPRVRCCLQGTCQCQCSSSTCNWVGAIICIYLRSCIILCDNIDIQCIVIFLPNGI